MEYTKSQIQNAKDGIFIILNMFNMATVSNNSRSVKEQMQYDLLNDSSSGFLDELKSSGYSVEKNADYFSIVKKKS